MSVAEGVVDRRAAQGLDARAGPLAGDVNHRERAATGGGQEDREHR